MTKRLETEIAKLIYDDIGDKEVFVSKLAHDDRYLCSVFEVIQIQTPHTIHLDWGGMRVLQGILAKAIKKGSLDQVDFYKHLILFSNDIINAFETNTMVILNNGKGGCDVQQCGKEVYSDNLVKFKMDNDPIVIRGLDTQSKALDIVTKIDGVASLINKLRFIDVNETNPDIIFRYKYLKVNALSAIRGFLNKTRFSKDCSINFELGLYDELKDIITAKGFDAIEINLASKRRLIKDMKDDLCDLQLKKLDLEIGLDYTSDEMVSLIDEISILENRVAECEDLHIVPVDEDKNQSDIIDWLFSKDSMFDASEIYDFRACVVVTEGDIEDSINEFAALYKINMTDDLKEALIDFVYIDESFRVKK